MTRRTLRSTRCFRILDVRLDCVVAAIWGKTRRVYFERVQR